MPETKREVKAMLKSDIVNMIQRDLNMSGYIYIESEIFGIENSNDKLILVLVS